MKKKRTIILLLSTIIVLILTSFCFYENENKSFNIQDVELVYSYGGTGDGSLYHP